MATLPLVGAISMALAMPISASANTLPQCAGTTNFLVFVNGNLVGEVQVPTTSNNSGNTNCILGQGDGPDSAVKALQNALDTCYGAGLNQDGVFGPLTKNALENAQRSEGFTGSQVDGVYGPMTRDHLDFRNLLGNTRCMGLDGRST